MLTAIPTSLWWQEVQREAEDRGACTGTGRSWHWGLCLRAADTGVCAGTRRSWHCCSAFGSKLLQSWWRRQLLSNSSLRRIFAKAGDISDRKPALDPRFVLLGRILQFPSKPPSSPMVGPMPDERWRTLATTNRGIGDLCPSSMRRPAPPSGSRSACCSTLPKAVLHSLGECRDQVPGDPLVALGDLARHRASQICCPGSLSSTPATTRPSTPSIAPHCLLPPQAPCPNALATQA